MRNCRTLILLKVCLLVSFPFAYGEEKTSEQPAVNLDQDSLYLESTFIGDKEQPTVSYFIPWKNTGTPDKLNWNLEEKYDESLELIDRDIMVRSMSIYNELDMEGVQSSEETTD